MSQKTESAMPTVSVNVPLLVPWYRRHGWVTMMAVSPVVIAVVAELIQSTGVLNRSGLAALAVLSFGVTAVLMPIVFVILVTGPVHGGSDKSGRWPGSTKGLVIAWTVLVIALVVWKLVRGLSA